MQQTSPRDHVTVISVSGASNSVFNFDDVSAVLESSSGVNPSELFGEETARDAGGSRLSRGNTNTAIGAYGKKL